MTAFLLNWKEGILFASLMIFLFTPWSRSLRHYILLGLVIYLLNQPLLANFHSGDMGRWLGDPAAWITAVTWVGSVVVFVRWLYGIKGQGVLSALSEVSWTSHFVAIPLIPLALFFFNLPVISPHFKTQPDYSFAIVLTTVPLQYFIGFSLMGFHGGSIKKPLSLSLIGVLLCVLLISLVHIPGTISEYRALLRIAPTQKGAAELIKNWETLLERNRVASINSIRGTAYGQIGDLKLSLGDMDGAQLSYQRALREDPNDVTGHIGLARLLIKERKTEQATEAFQKTIRRNPSLSWEQLASVFPPLAFYEIFVLAQALEAEGRQNEAFKAYGQALRMRPQNPWVNFRLGKIYFFQGNYMEAIAVFQKTLAKVPRHLYTLSYLVDIYEREDKMDLAQKYRDIILRELVTHRILPSDWKGRAGGDLYWKDGCHARVRLYRGTVKFTIHARGTPAQGVWPHMVLKLNREIIGEADVTTRKFRAYSFTKDVDTGEYALWVYFTNDLLLVKEVEGKKVREDRNLFVGDAEITYVR